MLDTRVPLLALFLYASSVVFSPSVAADCVPPPIAMRIENVTLASNRVRRGVSLKIGDPPQLFSFQPRWSNNNTFVYGLKCDGGDLAATNIACQTLRGGLYNPDNSSTKGTIDSDYKPLAEPWDSDSYDLVSESISLGQDDFTLKDFPIAQAVDTDSWNVQGYDPQNIIGMGQGSSLLSSLKSAGRITARAFGFYYGLDGVLDRDQAQGSFVLGGYDKAKTYGDGTTQLLTDNDNCPTKMMISIRDIVLNFRNGTDVSIFPTANGGTALLACIVPERPVLMEMPIDPYFDTMLNAIDNEEAARSIGLDYWNVVLNRDRTIYDGDLTFKLGSNLQITIPNHQLIVPERSINSEGRLAPNGTRPVIRINSLQNTTKGSFPVLGRYFFTSAYVFSNEDANQFTLWEANPTTDEDLVAVDEKDDILDTQATCTVQPTASADPEQGNGDPAGSDSNNDAGDSSNQTPPADKGLSTGALAGIAIGVVVPALIGIGILWWWCTKRKKAKSVEAQRGHQEASVVSVEPVSDTPKIGFPNQGFPHFIPQEMYSEQQPKIRPVELP